MIFIVKRLRVGVLLLELGILFCVTSLLLAQSIPCTPTIQLPQTLCSNTVESDCTLYYQMDETEATFVLNPKTGILIVYTPSNLVADQYTIPSNILPINGFIPLSSNS